MLKWHKDNLKNQKSDKKKMTQTVFKDLIKKSWRFLILTFSVRVLTLAVPKLLACFTQWVSANVANLT